MNATAFQIVTARLEAQTGYVPRGGKGNWRCPAHTDSTASLAVTEANDGKVLLHCHGGCRTDDVLAELGLTPSDLFNDDPAPKVDARPKIVATYPYTDAEGGLVFEVVRFDPKDFRQRRPDGAGGWVWNLNGTERVLYRLPQVLEVAARGERVYVVEGEKDVAAIEKAGWTATCNAGGAGKWRPEYAEALRGAEVIVVADRDAPGLAHARSVEAAVAGTAKSVVVMQPAHGKDVAEHLGAGRTLAELELLPPAATTEAPDETAMSPEVEEIRMRLELQARKAMPGGEFVFAEATEVKPVWGTGDEVLWAKGEPLLLAGPTGVGKTTLTGQLVMARIGLKSDVLGWPVERDDRRVLYIAADRPNQIRRSFRRMVGEEHREVLDERIEVWKGPLPYDIGKRPEVLAVMADYYGAGTVIIDSLKDIATGLSSEEVGQRVNESMQRLVADDVEVAGLHHQRKASGENKKPNSLSDVYGSVWLTAGAGSVLLLWGEAGDPLVELLHLKQPMEDVGPLKVRHDHHAGMSHILDQLTPWALIQSSPHGVTAAEAAKRLYDTESPAKKDIEKARRVLERLVREGKAHARSQPSAVGRDHVVYHPVTLLEQGEQ